MKYGMQVALPLMIIEEVESVTLICPELARAARAAAYEEQRRIPHVRPLHQQRDFGEIWGNARLRAKGLTR